MKENLNNTAIKVLSKKHGAKVIQWWKDQGVDTGNYNGTDVGWYYGLYDGCFESHSERYVLGDDIKVIELPEELVTEKTFPREMWVWNDDHWPKRLIVLAKIGHKYGYITQSGSSVHAQFFVGYQNALELDEMEELSVDQAELKLKELLGKIIKIKQ